uniref:Uncharacterized protein n=1 Tax=Anguilla anguilla TaxID=7936 RepID=A0A0E9XPE5_ANGAN
MGYLKFLSPRVLGKCLTRDSALVCASRYERTITDLGNR